tara:strand:- start:8 stop:214 length:207 start_codon:yes stop_codon:yes gene_type:complete
MINTELLKEESSQTIFLHYKDKWQKCKFMWFHNGNIEVLINGTLLSIHKRNWDKLSLNGIDLDSFCLN